MCMDADGFYKQTAKKKEIKEAKALAVLTRQCIFITPIEKL